MQKMKIGHRAKFRDKDNFSAGFISGSRDFTPYFHFQSVARANFLNFKDINFKLI